jgi:hypothetical protein
MDADQNAVIVDVLETDETALQPLLLRHAPGLAAESDALASKPLGRLYRAIDLIAGVTPEFDGAAARYMMIRNVVDRGTKLCRVEAVSTAYNYPWAVVILHGHISGLPVGPAFLMDLSTTAAFRDAFIKHDDWTIEPLPREVSAFEITAPGFAGKAALKASALDKNYRVGIEGAPGEKSFVLRADRIGRVRGFIAGRRREHDRANRKRKMPATFPKRLEVICDRCTANVCVDGQSALTTEFLTFNGTAAPTQPVWLAVADVENLLKALAKFETDVTGWFGDTDTADAQLNIVVTLGEEPSTADTARIIVPAVVSMKGDYAPACTALRAPQQLSASSRRSRRYSAA